MNTITPAQLLALIVAGELEQMMSTPGVSQPDKDKLCELYDRARAVAGQAEAFEPLIEMAKTMHRCDNVAVMLEKFASMTRGAEKLLAEEKRAEKLRTP